MSWSKNRFKKRAGKNRLTVTHLSGGFFTSPLLLRIYSQPNLIKISKKGTGFSSFWGINEQLVFLPTTNGPMLFSIVLFKREYIP
jgi:hypothetical protein